MKFPRAVRFHLLILLLTTFCFSSSNLEAIYTQAESELDAQVNIIIESMTVEEKIGQLFMVYWSGTNYVTPGLQELIADYKVGSIYISGSNFVNSETPTAAQQVAGLANQIQTYNWEQNQIAIVGGDVFFLPLFLAADHEGDGPRYTRIRTGMTPIPSQLSIGATWSIENSERIGQIVGSELSAIGINMLLGPVVDVVDNPSAAGEGNLDTRVFGGDPQWVGELGRAYIRGVQTGGEGRVITVAKHFPGHGDSDRATDRRVAITNKTLEELLQIDIVPFVRVTEQRDDRYRGVADAIMSSHIAIADTGTEPISLYYDVNEQRGGLERLFEDIEGLRHWYDDGFIVSDSLGVGAIKNLYGLSFPHISVATEAFLAGNDLLILHNFVPFGLDYSHPDVHDLEAHRRIKEVISHFQERYVDDPRFEHKINEAARKIVKAKLRLYPEQTIDSVLVDLDEIPNRAGTEQNLLVVNEIARQAIALLKPTSPHALTAAPQRTDRIVFVVHNFDLLPCQDCGDQWLEQIEHNIVDFLVNNRDFNRGNITTYYYYRRNTDDPAGISTFLYGWYLGVDHTLTPIQDNEVTDIRVKLHNADWIVFLFAAGDCGPDAYKTGATRCVRGRPESDTLHWFLQYAQDSDLSGKIVAFSFGAPPWRLDSTDVGSLEAYYGVFSQIEPFQSQAVRAFLREFVPLGASPIDVAATGYRLENVLVPSSAQPIRLQIVNEQSDSGWFVDDSVELLITGLVDQNGNPLLDGVPVAWTGTLDGRTQHIPEQSSNMSIINGQARATFALTDEGQITFSAEVGGVVSEPLTIVVQANPTPTFTPTASPTPPRPFAEASPATRAATPIPLSIVTTETDEAVSLEQPEPSDDGAVPEPDSPWFAESYVVAIFVMIIVVLVLFIVFSLRQPTIKTLLTSLVNNIVGVTHLPEVEPAETDFDKLSLRKSYIDRVRHNQQLDKSQKELRQKLEDHFNMGELSSLSHDLGVDFENIPGATKNEKALQLIVYSKRHGLESQLIALLREERPLVEW